MNVKNINKKLIHFRFPSIFIEFKDSQTNLYKLQNSFWLCLIVFFLFPSLGNKLSESKENNMKRKHRNTTEEYQYKETKSKKYKEKK